MASLNVLDSVTSRARVLLSLNGWGTRRIPYKGGSREVMRYAEKRGSHQPRLDLERLLAVIVLRVAARFGFLQVRVLWIRGTYIPARINISA